MKKKVICLLGPTASGKTNIACRFVQDHPLDIISVDSAMIYRELNIGSAKPTSDELKCAPHRLIDIRNPDESYSASEFCIDAKREIDAIHAHGRIPLLVGGTMMYFRALQVGLAPMPGKDDNIRQTLVALAREKGIDYLHAELARVDASSAKRIHAHDSQRIQRALEVYMITGKPMGEHWQDEMTSPYEFLNIVLFPDDRAWLHERIARRFHDLIQQGFIEEVKALIEKWHLNAQSLSMRSVGYRQVLGYLLGEYDYQSMLDKGIAATRQLAKRQLTWLRKWPEAIMISPIQDESYLQIQGLIEQFIV